MLAKFMTDEWVMKGMVYGLLFVGLPLWFLSRALCLKAKRKTKKQRDTWAQEQLQQGRDNMRNCKYS